MRKTALLLKKGFVDRVKLLLESGNGGNGNPKIGGKGGNGGNIFLVGNNKVKLEEIIDDYPGFQVKAPDGKESTRANVIGASGENVYINVPKGIDVSYKSGELIGTIENNDDKMIVARGGEGGGPLNNYLAKPSERVSIVLNLKLIADVGLVGFPNAGKSSFLKSISGVKARIANYAFTTLKPQIAEINYTDGRRITIADLPGIIEGAHVNVGLGHHFLKHVERTKLLLFVIDIYGFKLQSKSLLTSYRSPFETILLLNRELEIFNTHLLDKPAICLLNKVDKTDGDALSEFIMNKIIDGKLMEFATEETCPNKLVKFDKVIPISANTGFGIDNARMEIRNSLDAAALRELEEINESDLDKEFIETTQSFV